MSRFWMSYGSCQERCIVNKDNIRLTPFFMIMVVFYLAANFVHPVTPTLIQNLNLHDYMFGVALAAMMLTNFLVSPFWGKLNNRVNSRCIILVCCIGYGLSQLGFAFGTTEFQIIAARMMAGLFTGGIFVNILTYIAKVSPEQKRGKNLTISATISSVASAFGYLLGGIIGEFSIRGTFVAQTVILCLSGVLFYCVGVDDVKTETRGQYSISQLLKESNPFSAFLSCREFMTVSLFFLFSLCFLTNFSGTAFEQAFNYYLKAELQLGSSYNGSVKAVVGLLAFLSNTTLCMWIVSRTNTRKYLLLTVMGSSMFSLLIVLQENVAAFFIFAVCLYITYYVSIPVLQDIIVKEAVSGQENLVLGFYNSFKSLGSVFGSFAAGALYESSCKYPFICVFLVYGLAVVFCIFSLKRRAPYYVKRIPVRE